MPRTRSNVIVRYDFHDRVNVHHAARAVSLSALNRRDAEHECSRWHMLE